MGAILSAIIIGGIAGALAKLIMPGDDPGGIIVTILLGIVGAFVGSFITVNLLGMGGGGFLLAIYRLIVGRRATR